MTTIRTTILEGMVNRGLWPDQAESVLQRYESGPLGEAMRGKMDDAVDGYPRQLLAAVSVGVDSEVVRWMDDEFPEHFARPLFHG